MDVFYPRDGVSAIQKLQLVTQSGDNTLVAGINGSFDDGQRGVKRMLADDDLRRSASARGLFFSSANSAKVARILPQTVCHAWAYLALLRSGRLRDRSHA